MRMTNEDFEKSKTHSRPAPKTNPPTSRSALDEPQCFSCALYYPDDLKRNCALSNALLRFNYTIGGETTWWIEDCKEYKSKSEESE